MRPNLLNILTMAAMVCCAAHAAPLVPGDIAFVRADGDESNDTFSFVALVPVDAGQVVFFTDNGHTPATGQTVLGQSPFRGGENVFTWTATSSVPAGTVVTITGGDPSTVTTGTVGNTAGFNAASFATFYSTSGDQLFAYANTAFDAVNPVILAAVSLNGGVWQAEATNSNTSGNPNVTGGQGMPIGSGTVDAFNYTGITSGDRATLLAALSSGANFSFLDTASNDDPGAAPSFTVTGPAPQVTVNDVTVVETDGASTTLTFTVTRSLNDSAFTVDYAVTDGTATVADSDYVAASGTLTFAAGGALTQSVPVTVNGDNVVEASETLTITLSNLINTTGVATISDATGTGTISNDDFAGTPAMLVGENAFTATVLLTVGESIASAGVLNSSSAPSYQPAGILDGIGAYALDADTVRVFVNHELGSTVGSSYTLENGVSLKGARVSYFDINKTTKAVEDAGLAYGEIYDRAGNLVTNVSQVEGGGLNRFCSSSLYEPNEFGAGNGVVDRLYITGEEGTNGSQWALDVATGELWAVPALGRGNWENVTQLNTGTTTHVAFLQGDDGPNGMPLYLYVGVKNAAGDFLDRNGLKTGQMYVWKATEAGVNSPAEFASGTRAGTWVAINVRDAGQAGQTGYDALGYKNDTTLRTEADSLGAFSFSRPEDLSTNPFNGTQFAFASTGVATIAAGNTADGVADTSDPWGTIYTGTVNFSTISAPTGSMTVLYNGNTDLTRGLRSPDNLDWADDGFIYVNEDRSTTWTGQPNTNEASIVRINPNTGALLRVARVDRSAVPAGQTDGNPTDFGNWESSGVLDVSSLFGESPGELFFTDVQAHSINLTALGLQEGGQLLLLQAPATVDVTPTVLGSVGGSVSGGGSFAFGAEAEFTATPEAGYAFAGWTVNGAPAGSTSPLRVTTSAGLQVEAVFTASTTVSVNDVTVSEGNSGTKTATFTVTRAFNTGAFTVQFATSDGTASAGSDYVANTGNVSFTAGGTLTSTFTVTVNGDTTTEGNETFTVTLSNIVNSQGTATFSDATGVGTISNDDLTGSPSMLLGENGHVVQSLFTVGQSFTSTGALNSTSAGNFQPPGILDGIGAYSLDANTVRAFVNSELASNRGTSYTLENGVALTGARVSYFDINKTSKAIVDAGIAYRRMYDRAFNLVTNVSQVEGGGLNRLCSASLYEPNEFGAGEGVVDRLFFTGEEGTNGTQWVLDVATGDLWAVPAMGRGSWENVTQVDTGTTTHVAFVLGDDGPEGMPLYLYVGQKNAAGDFLERNGLKTGQMYVWKATAAGVNSPAEFISGTQAGTWVAINVRDVSKAGTAGYDALGYKNDSTLRAEADALGAFSFSRPEDLATNPADGKEIVFTSTGRSISAGATADGVADATDVWGFVYTVDLSFSTLAAPTGSVTVLYNGNTDTNRRLRSPDNLEWADDGFIYVNEDRSTTWTGTPNTNEASIIRITPATGALLRVARIDRSAVPASQTDGSPSDFGNWESSGIVDVTSLFGQAGVSYFLTDVQAHSINLGTSALVEGGQLALISVSDTDGDGLNDVEGAQLAALIADPFMVGQTVDLDLGAILFRRFPAPTFTISLTGLPPGLSYNSKGTNVGRITGTIADMPSAAGQITITQGRTPRATFPFNLTVRPFDLLGSYEALIENAAGLPVGKTSLTVTGPKSYSAVLQLIGEAKPRSTKFGSTTNLTSPLTVNFTKGGPEVSVVFRVSPTSDLVTGEQGANILRGFRLVSPGRGSNQAVTLALLPNGYTADGTTNPGGTGFATGSVSAKSATVSLKGQLGDAHGFTTTLSISTGRQAVVFFQPYKETASSYVGGIVTLGDVGLPGRGISTQLQTSGLGLKWVKAAHNGLSAATLRTMPKSYPNGIGTPSAPLGLTASFSRWVSMPSAEGLALSLGLTYRQIGVFPTAAPAGAVLPEVFSLRNGTVKAGFPLVRVAPANAVAWSSGRAFGVDGQFSGTLSLTRAAAVKGVFLQDDSFGTTVGRGLIKVETDAAKNYRTAAIELRNVLPGDN